MYFSIHKKSTYMKKVFTLAAISTLVLMSCKKDYVCECTQTVSEPAFSAGGQVVTSGSTTTTSTSNTINAKKNDAETSCISNNTTTTSPSPYSSFGQGETTTKVECAIK